jgi:hypothetical protein
MRSADAQFAGTESEKLAMIRGQLGSRPPLIFCRLSRSSPENIALSIAGMENLRTRALKEARPGIIVALHTWGDANKLAELREALRRALLKCTESTWA